MAVFMYTFYQLKNCCTEIVRIINGVVLSPATITFTPYQWSYIGWLIWRFIISHLVT